METQADEQRSQATDLLTSEQVAERLQVTEQTVYNLRKTRGLPYIKITPNIVRHRWPEVEDWLKRHSVHEVAI